MYLRELIFEWYWIFFNCVSYTKYHIFMRDGSYLRRHSNLYTIEDNILMEEEMFRLKEYFDILSEIRLHRDAMYKAMNKMIDYENRYIK